MDSKKFVMSYSGGKDCMLAMYRKIKEGWTPVALITTVKKDSVDSWTHSISKKLLEKASENLWEAKVLLGLNLMYSTTDTYNLDPMDSSGAFFDFGYIELLDENRNEEEFSKGVDLVLQAYHMNPKGLDKLCLKLKKLNVIYEDKED